MFCGNHIGMPSCFLRKCRENRTTALRPELAFDERLVSGGNGSGPNEYVQFMRRLLAEGVVKATA